jgi:hypothetical protein
MSWESVAGQLLRLLDHFIPQLGARPIVSYEVAFTAGSFVLDVRVGNRGRKPCFVSEVWLCAPGRSQALCLYREHIEPQEIQENGGRVYTLPVSFEDAKPYAKSGSYVQVVDATGRKYTKRLARKSIVFLAEDFATKFSRLRSTL